MSSPNSTNNNSRDSQSSHITTFSDIINALDESYERIRSMGAEDIQRERNDSVNSLAATQAKTNDRRVAFDQKKYLADYEAGRISLTQIQVAANARKTPEQHIEDYYRVNGPMPEPWFGTGKCTYPPYNGPTRSKREVLSDNIDDAIKKVKSVFQK